MPDEHVHLLRPRLRVDLVQPHPVVEPRDDQPVPHDLPHVHPNPVSPHFVLIPEQDQLVLVPRHQDAAHHQSHSDRLFVVRSMRHHHVQSIPLHQHARATVGHEDRSGLKVQVSNRRLLGPDRHDQFVGGRHHPDIAIRFADQPVALVDVGAGGDELVPGRSEDILLRVRVDAGGPILRLPDSIQVLEDGLDVFFVLEEKGVLYGLGQFVHLLQRHFLLLLV